MNDDHTPTTQIVAADKAALLKAIHAVLDYDNGVATRLTKLSRFGDAGSMSTLLFQHYMRDAAAFSELSSAAKRFLGGGDEKALSATLDAAVRFAETPPHEESVRKEIAGYFLRNRLVGHWGLGGEWGNGVGQMLLNLSSRAELLEPEELIAAMKKVAERWDTHPSQLAQYQLGQLPEYKGETVGKAMHRLPAELRAWVEGEGAVRPEHRAQLLRECEAYEEQVQKLETVLHMVRDFGTEKLSPSPEQSRG